MCVIITDGDIGDLQNSQGWFVVVLFNNDL